MAPRRWHAWLDRVGAAASMLCAVHCALLPFVLALLPLVGLGFLGGEWFERIFVTCAAALAATSLLLAYRRHRQPLPIMLMVPGISMLVFGIFMSVHEHVLVHTGSVVTGGVLVAIAHVTNLVLSHRQPATACGHRAG